jgi:hypothetical protein
MIIKKPQPFPEPWPTHIVTEEEIYNTDTSPDIHAIPKEEAKQEKSVLQQWMPPAYWHPVLPQEDTKLEQVCKRWFSRLLIAAMILYVLLLTSIFLWKLLMIVIALK